MSILNESKVYQNHMRMKFLTETYCRLKTNKIIFVQCIDIPDLNSTVALYRAGWLNWRGSDVGDGFAADTILGLQAKKIEPATKRKESHWCQSSAFGVPDSHVVNQCKCNDCSDWILDVYRPAIRLYKPWVVEIFQGRFSASKWHGKCAVSAPVPCLAGKYHSGSILCRANSWGVRCHQGCLAPPARGCHCLDLEIGSFPIGYSQRSFWIEREYDFDLSR